MTVKQVTLHQVHKKADLFQEMIKNKTILRLMHKKKRKENAISKKTVYTLYSKGVMNI